MKTQPKPGKQRAIFRMMQLDPDLTKPQAEQTFRRVIDSFKEDIEKHKRINIPDFGTFTLKKTTAKPRRKVRNPFTGEMVWAKPKPAGTKVRFRKSKGWTGESRRHALAAKGIKTGRKKKNYVNWSKMSAEQKFILGQQLNVLKPSLTLKEFKKHLKKK